MVRGLLLSLALFCSFVIICKGQDLCVGNAAEASCDGCIQTNPDCVWCSYNPGPNATSTMTNRRCYNRTDIDSCPAGLSAVEDPPVIVTNTRDAVLSNESIVGQESVQVRPQAVNMTLRPGDPQSFIMSFIALRNTPVDVYFMLDVSASLVLTFEALRDNLQIIADSISDISSAYQIGIGGFIDKDVFPYGGSENYRVQFGADPICRQANRVCSTPIGYRHYLKLTSNISKFQEVLDNQIELAINVDTPEGGLDALMQMAVCTDIIGWRPQALRMVFLVTDSDYHIAGDGYLAGLFKPNDGKCHLEEIPDNPGQYEYTYSTLQDYPSIHQLLAALQESLIVPTFGIQESGNNLRTYEVLSQEFRTIQASAIGIDSQGNSSSTAQAIIDLINRAYEATSQTVQVIIPSVEGYQIDVEPLDCQLITSEGGCMVNFSDIINFRVTVELTDCSVAGVETIALRGAPYVFSDIVVHPSCSCACSAEEFHVPLSENCNSNGTEICSACDCDPGRSGDFCECDSDTTESCPQFDGMECGGSRGMCSSCGECMCIPPYFGPQQGCKCDNESCSQECLANGVCICDSMAPYCQCTGVSQLSGKPLLGNDCCDPDPVCFNTNVMGVPNLRLCQILSNLSSAGECSPDCSRCDCEPNLQEMSGLCLPTDLCSFFEPCVRSHLGDSTVNPDTGCNYHPQYNTTNDDEEIDRSGYSAELCFFIHNDGCTYNFERGIEPFALPVLINSTPVCPGLPNWAPYVFAGAAVVAIFLIGLVLICLLKLCVVAWDKREFKKFTQELQHADFAPHENPLYLTPQQDYQNPILRRHSSKRKS